MITIMRKFNDGWCEGELNGKKGVFPSNYVTDLAPPEDDEEEYVGDGFFLYYFKIQ